MNQPIKVLVVDDSALVRKVISQQLEKHDDIMVVGKAKDPYTARDMITTLNPDVILLDIEMPRMDGITFLQKLMQHYPSRVIIVSSLAEKGSDIALKALESGALDVIEKPGYSLSISQMGEELAKTIRTVARIPIGKLGNRKERVAAMPREVGNLKHRRDTVLAIGASTGGVEAITEVLRYLPPDAPPIVIVQHMPKQFTASFAKRLDSLCAIHVKEAEEMEILTPGKAMIAPGDMHITIRKRAGVYYVKYADTEPVHYQKPAVDVLFDSVAKEAKDKSIGVLLTGMGRDGAKGLLSMKLHGAYTIAQDEESSTVFGMPKEAIQIGAAEAVLPLRDVCQHVLQYLER
jgi:two-component system chemotaxis response regulator CheB